MSRLCALLREPTNDKQVTFHAESEYCLVEPNEASHVAFIVNELLSNGIKQAHRNVVLTLSCDPDHVEIVVADDGDGVPEDFEMDYQQGFGLRLVSMIAGRLGGQISLTRGDDGGSRAEFGMPLLRESMPSPCLGGRLPVSRSTRRPKAAVPHRVPSRSAQIARVPGSR